MAKSDKSDRRAVLDQIRNQQKRAERRRTLLVVGACVVIALLIVGAAAYRPVNDWWDLREIEATALSDIGAAADVCGEVTTKPATGNEQHVPEGTEVAYADAPPAFGEHYPDWEGMERKLYTAADRPPIARLVHNLEHGFTILWYDESIAEDDQQMDAVRAVAAKHRGTDDLRLKFKAAPWTEEDGEAFPEGQHVAFTHWSAGGTGPDATQQQVGVWQYCSEVSGAALEQFMIDYPYMDSPEPLAR